MQRGTCRCRPCVVLVARQMPGKKIVLVFPFFDYGACIFIEKYYTI